MKNSYYTIPLLMLFLSGIGLAQNPLINDQYTADPTARVFNEKVSLPHVVAFSNVGTC